MHTQRCAASTQAAPDPGISEESQELLAAAAIDQVDQPAMPDTTFKSLSASIAANERWGRLDAAARSEATRPGRTALEQKFLDLAGGDPVRAQNLKRAHFQKMALASAKVRKARKEYARIAAGPVDTTEAQAG